MPPYRAFFVGEDGHFQKAVVLYCADDTAAVQEAKKLVDDRNIELWKMERRIAILKSPSNKSAAMTPVCSQCGSEMRLRRVEPDVKTNKEIQTYACPTCGLADRVKAEGQAASVGGLFVFRPLVAPPRTALVLFFPFGWLWFRLAKQPFELFLIKKRL